MIRPHRSVKTMAGMELISARIASFKSGRGLCMGVFVQTDSAINSLSHLEFTVYRNNHNSKTPQLNCSPTAFQPNASIQTLRTGRNLTQVESGTNRITEKPTCVANRGVLARPSWDGWPPMRSDKLDVCRLRRARFPRSRAGHFRRRASYLRGCIVRPRRSLCETVLTPLRDRLSAGDSLRRFPNLRYQAPPSR